jgi:hypothetical protein
MGKPEDAVNRFERAVRATNYRVSDERAETEFVEARTALLALLDPPPSSHLRAAIEDALTILRRNPDASQPPRYRNIQACKVLETALAAPAPVSREVG